MKLNSTTKTSRRCHSVTFDVVDYDKTNDLGSTSSMDNTSCIASSTDSLHNDSVFEDNNDTTKTQSSTVSTGFRVRSSNFQNNTLFSSFSEETNNQTKKTLKVERDQLLCEARRLNETNRKLSLKNSIQKAQITKAKCDLDRKDDEIEILRKCIVMLGQKPDQMIEFVMNNDSNQHHRDINQNSSSSNTGFRQRF